MAAKKLATDAASRELRAFGMTYPGAHLKSPWPGHGDLAVNDKTFAYLTVEGEPFKISCKLPVSAAMVLMLPFAKPTAYGLGKAGWVTMEFADEKIPTEMLMEWIDESYRAIAPKKRIAELAARPEPTASAKPAATAKRRSTAKAKAKP